MTKATDTHSEHVTFTAFAQQQWLGKCASISHYTCLSCYILWTMQY